MSPKNSTKAALGASITLLFASLLSGFPADASVDHGTIRTFEQFGPDIVSDLPCLEGTAFVSTGTTATTIHFVDALEGFHFFILEHHEGSLVPVGGTGPTYVESGNEDHQTFNASFENGVIVYNHVNNDSFVPMQDGKRSGPAIRIHEHETFVALDTDGDGQPDVIHVDTSQSRLTCP
jgi:hypothetical protein